MWADSAPWSASPGIRSNAITADQVAYAKTALAIPTGPSLRLSVSLEHARARGLDDGKTYGVSGLGLTGDLPGFRVVHLGARGPGLRPAERHRRGEPPEARQVSDLPGILPSVL